MKILILDNYDSFTYNLYHYIEQSGADVDVFRNDEISLEDVEKYSHIVISPGPGLPADAGISMSVLDKYHANKNILGVCLGCQAIAEYFGGKLYNQKWVAHGISRKIKQYGNSVLYRDMPEEFEVGLYHSWAIDEVSLPHDLRATAHSQNGVLMSLEHRNLSIFGVQFHPESIMTQGGIKIIENWLKS